MHRLARDGAALAIAVGTMPSAPRRQIRGMIPSVELRHYTLRPATAADRAFIYQLRVLGLKDYVARIWGWDEAVQVARFQAGFDPIRYQVIVVAGRDAGALAIEWRDDLVFLADIEIAPDWRGRGLGTAVISAILSEAEKRGLPVALQVLQGNPARGLYERLGFQVVAHTESHYHMRTARTGRDDERATAVHDDA